MNVASFSLMAMLRNRTETVGIYRSASERCPRSRQNTPQNTPRPTLAFQE